jgi:heterotetrameric sarcosine oxidase gamma subunit
MLTRPQPVRLTALEHQHQELGAQMSVDSGLWRRPLCYSTIEKELDCIRRSVAICDISPTSKLSVRGTGIDRALPLLAAIQCNFRPGQAARIILSANGTERETERLYCWIGQNEVWVLGPPGNVLTAEKDVAMKLDGSVSRLHFADLTSVLAAVKVMGPRSADVLNKLSSLDLRSRHFPQLSCAQSSLAGVQAMIVHADEGEHPGYEVYFARDVAESVWTAIMHAGREFDIAPFGVQLLNQLSSRG